MYLGPKEPLAHLLYCPNAPHMFWPPSSTSPHHAPLQCTIIICPSSSSEGSRLPTYPPTGQTTLPSIWRPENLVYVLSCGAVHGGGVLKFVVVQCRPLPVIEEIKHAIILSDSFPLLSLHFPIYKTTLHSNFTTLH